MEKLKKVVKFLASSLMYYAIAFSIGSIFLGGQYLSYTYSESEFYFAIMASFILIVGIVFITIPTITYFLIKKRFEPILKSLIPLAAICFGIFIGPIIGLNLMPYSKTIDNLESYAKRGHWEEVNKSYKALYFRHPKTGIEYIKRCQLKLKLAGYYNGDVDGFPNNSVPEAIMTFQNKFGLPENQKIDDNSNTILITYIFPDKFGLTKQDIHFNNILVINSAVARFQKQNGLSPDGWIGEETEKKVFNQ
jgi:hypothetical protein